MLQAGKLQDVIDTGVPFTWAEAVAVVQQVIASCERERAGTSSPPRLENVWLAPDGSVFCDGGVPALTVGQAATLLDALLRHARVNNVPGGLQYTLARATRQVDAPPVESIAAFATALARHERAERSVILSELYSRMMDLAGTADAPPSARVVSMPCRASTSEPAPVAREGQAEGRRVSSPPDLPERRRSGPSVAELRRALRVADAERYARVGENVDADSTRLPHTSDLYDPVLARTEADTGSAVPSFLDSEIRPRHLGQWIVGAMAAVLIAFGVGYGATYEWRHRGTPHPRVLLVQGGSPPAMGKASLGTVAGPAGK
jgi:hypothetical protein